MKFLNFVVQLLVALTLAQHIMARFLIVELLKPETVEDVQGNVVDAEAQAQEKLKENKTEVGVL